MADLQALTRCIMDSLPGGVLTTDEHGRVLAVEQAAATIITGREAGDLLGADVSHVLELPADAGSARSTDPTRGSSSSST